MRVARRYNRLANGRETALVHFNTNVHGIDLYQERSSSHQLKLAIRQAAIVFTGYLVRL